MIFDYKQVIEQEKRLLGAIMAGDHKTLDLILHPNAVLVHPSGQVLNKKMYMEFYQKYLVEVTYLKTDDYFINIAGDTATVTLLTKIAWTAAEQNHQGHYRYLRTWKIFDQIPQLLSAACIQINP